MDEPLQRLEGAAAEFENVINEASRNLLVVAVERIFSNLRRLQPNLDLETVTTRVEDEQTVPLSRAVASVVNAYVDRFKRSLLRRVPLRRTAMRRMKTVALVLPLEGSLQLVSHGARFILV